MPLVLGRRHAGFAFAALTLTLVLTASIVATEPLAAASTTPSGTLTLVSQTSDLIGPGQFSLGLDVHSELAPDELGVELTLYSALPNRTLFDQTLNDTELPSESCITHTGARPLTGLSGSTASGLFSIELPVSLSTSSPRCAAGGTALDLGCTPGRCAGVYPLRVALVDTANGVDVASFTTHVIEIAPSTNRRRLTVAVVVPFGSTVAIAPNGRSTLNDREDAQLDQTLDDLSAYQKVHTTVALYSQLLLALTRQGSAGQAVRRHLDAVVTTGWALHSLEPLDQPFAPLDSAALAAAGLGSTLTDATDLANAELAGDLGRTPAANPYLVPAPIDTAGIAELAGNCIHELVLPPGSIAPGVYTQTSPVLVSPTLNCAIDGQAQRAATIAFVADATSYLFSDQSNDPVLKAHQLLASLAQIYFEMPNAVPRGVVLTAPGGAVDPTLLRVVLAGLSTNPIFQTSTLGALFATVPVSSDDGQQPVALAPLPSGLAPLPKSAIDQARSTYAAIASLLSSNRALLKRLYESIGLAQTAGMATATRDRYLSVPSEQLSSIGASLTFIGSHTVTLTSRSGKVPITIDQAGPTNGPMRVIVKLSSSELGFPQGSSHPVLLSTKDTLVPDARVFTRTSGTSHLYVEIVSPVGNRVLARGTYNVTSTAVSGVAVALSIGALVVLLGWWGRSEFRRRRHRTRADPAPAASST